jgi:hypothetical protein
MQLLGQFTKERPKMQLSIVGCPDKQRFRPYVKRAALFYAESLMTPRMLENIFLRIKFSSKINAHGYASVVEFSRSNKPRQFEIELHPGIGAAEILKTLSHEMVHIKQYVHGDVNINLTRWKGSKVLEPDYWFQPWEVEAYGMQSGLFTKFAVKEKLWEVFDHVVDPDSPIEIEPLGWK